MSGWPKTREDAEAAAHELGGWISIEDVRRGIEDEYRGWSREEVQRLYFGRCRDPEASAAPGPAVRDPRPSGEGRP